MSNQTKINIQFIFLILLLLSFGDAKSDEYKRVYLATYPRSGNTWTRELLEEATGILTCVVYNNPQFQYIYHPWNGYSLPNGLNDQRRQPGLDEPIVIKTHFPFFDATPCDLQTCKKIIRIIRNPIDSIYSFHVYVGNAKGSKISTTNLDQYIEKWKEFHSYWDKQENVVTIRYEDLLNSCYDTFSFIIEEIGYQLSVTDLERSISKYPPMGYELKSAKYFSNDELNFIYNKLEELMKKYGYDNGFLK